VANSGTSCFFIVGVAEWEAVRSASIWVRIHNDERAVWSLALKWPVIGVNRWNELRSASYRTMLRSSEDLLDIKMDSELGMHSMCDELIVSSTPNTRHVTSMHFVQGIEHD
jgi:hypothetical protein